VRGKATPMGGLGGWGRITWEVMWHFWTHMGQEPCRTVGEAGGAGQRRQLAGCSTQQYLPGGSGKTAVHLMVEWRNLKGSRRLQSRHCNSNEATGVMATRRCHVAVTGMMLAAAVFAADANELQACPPTAFTTTKRQKMTMKRVLHAVLASRAVQHPFGDCVQQHSATALHFQVRNSQSCNCTSNQPAPLSSQPTTAIHLKLHHVLTHELSCTSLAPLPQQHIRVVTTVQGILDQNL